MSYRICVSIGAVSVDECLDIIRSSDMAEIRLDLVDIGLQIDNIAELENDYTKTSEFEEKLSSNIKKLFASSDNLIATCRANKDLDDEKRFKILSYAIDSGAKYVDVELDSSDEFKERMIKKIKASSAKLIISYHNCKETPSAQELQNILEACKSYKADIVKIACLSHSNRDNARLLALLDTDTPLIVVGMGKEGRLSRFIAPLLGSYCTFASPLGYGGTAPGQLTKKELEDFLKIYNE
jgi:3-dehydroquinate dehydratase type I